MVASSAPDAMRAMTPSISSSTAGVRLGDQTRRLATGSRLATVSITAGTNRGAGSPSCAARLRASRRLVNNCVGVRPCRRAVAQTLSTPEQLSAMIAAFSSALQIRRWPAPVNSSIRRAAPAVRSHLGWLCFNLGAVCGIRKKGTC